jgi:glycosyltransferase involved in cell wall biosynthesis
MIKQNKNLDGQFPNGERHIQPELVQHQTGSFRYDLIVFSHLRWNFVFQRPQHIISRLAAQRKILFVEEPVAFAPREENTAILIPVNKNITVFQPRVREIGDIGPLLKKYTGKNLSAAWFYSPAFCPVFDSVNFRSVIYDCMDELSLFKGADPMLIEQERNLLSRARIVFTGGKSLYEAKSKVHPNVHCFPSSVEQSHFRKALNGIAVPEDIARLKHTVIGYYGVIDERIDLKLLDEVSLQMPGVSLVMIGPLAKIKPEELPRRPNIHYFGMRQYELLPNYLKAFDIAMMPFAMNDSTKFISPTKTLEYMAAGKPIISTPVFDVVRDYRNHVNIVSDPREFCDAHDSIMQQINSGSYNADKYNDILQSTSWDDTVKCMEKLLGNIPVPKNEKL